MNTVRRQFRFRSSVLGWLSFASMPILVALFFSVSAGIAAVAVFTFLFLCVLAAIVALVYQKLAFQRQNRTLPNAGSSH